MIIGNNARKLYLFGICETRYKKYFTISSEKFMRGIEITLYPSFSYLICLIQKKVDFKRVKI